MRVLLPAEIENRLVAVLRGAGRREIGGILMGEKTAEGVFRIRDLSVQRRGGGIAFFVREVRAALAHLGRFFRETGHDYTRYNYLGEWHSHPSFPVRPSRSDSESMWRIVEDPAVGANFAVLLIVRLTAEDALEASATTYLPERRTLEVFLESEVGRRLAP